MKNLKRIFSLALAGTMLAGMLTVGASAVTFTDAEDIKNNDAVNFMVALNIINGKDDGSFDPEATVTRAEMAKMITIALNGGREPVLGTKVTPTYTDIKGNWAEKYIEYCSNLGIIGGRGNGTFDPAGTVTGTEAAKMMLVAMGYDSTVFNFTGADWAINVNTEANNATPNKLYKGLESIDPNAGLSRDNAAQLIFNGVQDYIMEKSPSLTITNGEITYGYNKMDGTYGSGAVKTILSEKYGYLVEYGYMTAASYDEDKDEYTYHIDANANFGGDDIDTKICFTNGDNDKTVDEGDVTFAEDVSNLFAQQVKVVYDAEEMEAVGIYAANSKVLTTAKVGDIAGDFAANKTSIKLNDVTYKFDGAVSGAGKDQADKVKFYAPLNDTALQYGDGSTDITLENGGRDTSNSGGELKVEWAVDAIDNDGDGRINCMLVHPVKVGKITYLGSETMTVDNTIGSFDRDDVNLYEGAKKGDWVIVTDKAYTVDGKAAIVKAEIIESTIDATKTTGDNSVRVDGVWYKKADGSANGTVVAGKGDIGKDVTMVVVNGYYAYLSLNKSVNNDILVIYELGNAGDFNNNKSARVVLGDGSKATVRVSKSDDFVGADFAEGVFYTYEVKNNEYVLTEATTANTEYTAVVSGASYDPDDKAMTTGEFIADDAMVIIAHNGGDGKNTDTDGVSVSNLRDLKKVDIITGKDLKKWKASGATVWGDAAKTAGFATTTNGIKYVDVLFMAFDAKNLPTNSGTDKYGYIVSDSIRTKDNGEYYLHFDLWNGEETVSVTEQVPASQGHYSKGTFVQYTDLGNDEVEIIKSTFTDTAPVADTTAAEGKVAIMGYNAADEVISVVLGVNSSLHSFTVDKDTVVIYVNSKDGKGAGSDGITLATELADGSYDQNAVILTDTACKHVEVIFIDINNKIKSSTPVSAPASVLAKPAAGTAANTIFADADDGVYSFPAGTTKTEVTGLSTTINTLEDLRFFKFEGEDGVGYTLKIFAAGDDPETDAHVYTENGTVTGNGAHYFYVNVASRNSGKGWDTATSRSYIYQITKTSGGNLISTGGFSL